MKPIHYKPPSLADKFIQHFEPLINPSRMIHPTNIIENEKNFILEIYAPGFEKKDFTIAVEDNYLNISGSLKQSSESAEVNTKKNDKNYIQQEFYKQSFHKSFSLGTCSIDDKNIKASYHNGVLYITVPKKDHHSNCKKIINIE